MNLQLVKEAPPGRSEYDEVMQQVASEPGTWFRVLQTADPDEAQRVALALRAYSQRRDDAWRISKRGLGEGGFGVWACYGEPAGGDPDARG
jgi:hypothetical protein